MIGHANKADIWWICPYRKRGEPLDFNNLPELPPEALALADPKDISLKSWGTKAPTLLPEDLHYKVTGIPILELDVNFRPKLLNAFPVISSF